MAELEGINWKALAAGTAAGLSAGAFTAKLIVDMPKDNSFRETLGDSLFDIDPGGNVAVLSALVAGAVVYGAVAKTGPFQDKITQEREADESAALVR